MHRFEIFLTDAALSALAGIAGHIAQMSPVRALTFADELRTACLGLADMPERFAVVPRYAARGVRRRVHGAFLIFYRIEPDQVQILHVLHGAMDHEAVLFPEG